MRFCHVTTYYPPFNFGGDGIAVQMVCEALARRGHDVDVVHCADAYELRGHRTDAQVSDPPGIRRFTMRSPLGALSPMLTQQSGRPGLKHRRIREILSDGYDVVHFHNISLIGGPGVIPMSRAPVTLYTTHDHWLFCPTHVLWKNRSRPCDRPTCFTCSIRSGIPPQLWRHTGLVRRCLRHVDALLCPSEFTARLHREAGIDAPVHVHRWYSRMTPASAESNRSRLAARADQPPLFAFAGRLVASKGIDHLLEAFARRPGYRLDVAGDGPLRDGLQRRYAAYPHMRFLGAISGSELEKLLCRVHAVILPAWGPEAGPLSLLEAQACGAPAVVRRAGGSAETIELTGGGLVYDRTEELLPLVDRLAGDLALCRSLSERAAAGSREHFTEERWMEQYFGIIRQVGRMSGPSPCEKTP